MLFVFGAIDVARFVALIVFEDLFDVDDAAKLALAVVECGPRARRRRLFTVDGQNDGNAPGQSVRETHRGNDALVIGPSHEAGQRAEGAVADEREIVELATGERESTKSLRGFAQFLFGLRRIGNSIDEFAAVRSDHDTALSSAT